MIPMTTWQLFKIAAARPSSGSYPRRRGFFGCSCKLRVWRPSLDDVQRLSEGRAAKNRGAGSRQVPHRLNADEVKLFKLAKEKGFLTLRGSGYRRERKGSPLANIYRQWCDALASPCVIVEQDAGGGQDTVLVDLSPLRGSRLAEVAQACHAAAAELGFSPADTGSLPSPFTVLVPIGVVQPPVAAVPSFTQAVPSAAGRPAAGGQLATPPQQAAQLPREGSAEQLPSGTLPSSGDSGGSSGSSSAPAAEAASSTEGGHADAQRSEAPGQASADQGGGSLPAEAAGVVASDASAGQGLESGTTAPTGVQPDAASAAADAAVDPSMLTDPIWRQAPRLVGFLVDRNEAKSLAKALASQLVTTRA